MNRIKNIINGSTKKDKYKIRDRFRHLFQFVWFLITNSYFEGFKTGKIYGGNLKKICVPGMNCYSCPGAKGSCPIGSLQAVIGNSKYKISYYIVGILSAAKPILPSRARTVLTVRAKIHYRKMRIVRTVRTSAPCAVSVCMRTTAKNEMSYQALNLVSQIRLLGVSP